MKPKTLDDVIVKVTAKYGWGGTHFKEQMEFVAQAAIDSVIPKDKSEMKTENALQDMMLREYNLSRDSESKQEKKLL